MIKLACQWTYCRSWGCCLRRSWEPVGFFEGKISGSSRRYHCYKSEVDAKTLEGSERVPGGAIFSLVILCRNLIDFRVPTQNCFYLSVSENKSLYELYFLQLNFDKGLWRSINLLRISKVKAWSFSMDFALWSQRLVSFQLVCNFICLSAPLKIYLWKEW